MKIHLLAIVAVACSSFYGCASMPDDPASAQDPAAAAPSRPGSYRTGSRIPSYEPAGASSVGAVSRDDYTDDMRARGRPVGGK